MSESAEAELIAQCLRGEAAAWDELFALHYAPTSRFVFQLSAELSREDTDEICQETFLAVIKGLVSFQGTSRVQTWIFRIAANKARDHREKQRAAKRGGGSQPLSLNAEDAETGLVLDPPTPLPGPDVLLINAEGMQLVSQALEHLGEPCREIIELRYFADLSYEEISSELGLNQKTVSSRLSKCLSKLESVATALFSKKKTAPFPVS